MRGLAHHVRPHRRKSVSAEPKRPTVCVRRKRGLVEVSVESSWIVASIIASNRAILAIVNHASESQRFGVIAALVVARGIAKGRLQHHSWSNGSGLGNFVPMLCPFVVRDAIGPLQAAITDVRELVMRVRAGNATRLFCGIVAVDGRRLRCLALIARQRSARKFVARRNIAVYTNVMLFVVQATTTAIMRTISACRYVGNH
mmetsp:Transcript_52615/g.83593  ORF Transcript_52615/g.83593 Transcript_52615/m.83593 type:complete len:201 (+) Transcript_52615:432-1034(+)